MSMGGFETSTIHVAGRMQGWMSKFLAQRKKSATSPSTMESDVADEQPASEPKLSQPRPMGQQWVDVSGGWEKGSVRVRKAYRSNTKNPAFAEKQNRHMGEPAEAEGRHEAATGKHMKP